MKKLYLTILIFAALIFAQCAYFNTFYNAKRYYRLGYLETQKNMTGKVSSQEKNNYQKTIEKCAKIIEYYPKSRYVDDALLLMGKAYFYMEEYVKASRKFEELVANYPESEYYIEADLWRARSLLELQEFEAAENIMDEMVSKEIPDELRGDAYYYFGLFHQKRDAYDDAINAFVKASKTASKDLRIKALMSLGQTFDTTGVYIDAALAYKNILKYNPVDEVEFLSQYQYGRMLRKAGESQKAIPVFERLYREEQALAAGQKSSQKQVRISNIRLQLAACLVNEGQIEDAIVAYQDIAEEYKKKGASAKALYEMGKIYEYYYGDYFRASDNYNLAQEESKSSVWADSAKVLQRDIERLDALQRVIAMSEGKSKSGSVIASEEEIDEDTLTAQIIFDVLEKATSGTDNNQKQLEALTLVASKHFADSVALLIDDLQYQREKRDNELPDSHEGEGVNWQIWYDLDIMPSFTQVEFLEEELAIQRERYKELDLAENEALSHFKVEEKDRNLFLLAELYWFRFDLPDSAQIQYLKLLNEFPKSPFAPQAAYNTGYLQMHDENTENDTTMQFLITKYPGSSYANEARKLLDLPLKKTLQDSILDMFYIAERNLATVDTFETVIAQYDKIYQAYPETEYAAKALYSIGWIYDHKMHDPQNAMIIYDSLLTTFPASVYAEQINIKMNRTKTELEKAKQDSLRAVQQDSLAQLMPVDSSRVLLTSDSLQQALPIDSNQIELNVPPTAVPQDTMQTEP